MPRFVLSSEGDKAWCVSGEHEICCCGFWVRTSLAGICFKRVAVTIASSSVRAISETRKFEMNACSDVSVFSVCNTHAGDAGVQHVSKADVACTSASSILRTRIGNKALIQLGVTIPAYALTEKGRADLSLLGTI